MWICPAEQRKASLPKLSTCTAASSLVVFTSVVAMDEHSPLTRSRIMGSTLTPPTTLFLKRIACGLHPARCQQQLLSSVSRLLPPSAPSHQPGPLDLCHLRAGGQCQSKIDRS